MDPSCCCGEQRGVLQASGNPPQRLPSQFFLGRAPPRAPQCPPTHTHQGKAVPPAAQPPPISYPWQPDQPSRALQPFGERVVSTWSAHLRTAAASAGLSHHLRHRPRFPPPGPPPSPWVPSWLRLCARRPAPRYQHRSFHLMLTAPPRSYKLCTGRFWHLPETEVSPVQ